MYLLNVFDQQQTQGDPQMSVSRLTCLQLTSRTPSCRSCFTSQLRTISSSVPLHKKDQLPPRPKIAEEETFKRYLKGSGPGGQKINKTSSAVQLTHLPTGIVVKSQATRSRTQNESIARRILAEKVEILEKGSESRVEKKRERVSQKKRSAEKKSRRKYRKLAEERAGVEGEGIPEEHQNNGAGEEEHLEDTKKVK